MKALYLIIPFAPLLGAIAAGLFGKQIGRVGAHSVTIFAVLLNRIYGTRPLVTPVPADYSNTKELGRVLYTQYAFAFEIAAVLLLVAIIAAIALTLRRRKDSRSQDPSAQVRARREDRVQLVSMPSETDR